VRDLLGDHLRITHTCLSIDLPQETSPKSQPNPTNGDSPKKDPKMKKKKRALERRRGEALHYVGGRLPPPARAGARGARRRTVGRQQREGVINQICGGWEGQRTGGRGWRVGCDNRF
jgi:hypothetical protein